MHEPAVQGQTVNTQWIAQDVLFTLCGEFLASGVSTILDLNLGWAFQWECLDAIAREQPDAVLLPILLRCAHAICLEPIRRRHAERPDRYDPPEVFTTDERMVAVVIPGTAESV